MLVGGEENGIRLGDEAVDGGVEGGAPLDAGYAGALGGGFLGELFPLPDGDVVVGLAEKKDFPVVGIMRSGEEDEGAFLLDHAGEVEEVVALLEGEGCVGVGGVDVVRVDDGDGVFVQQGCEVFPVCGEEGCGRGSGAHGNFKF